MPLVTQMVDFSAQMGDGRISTSKVDASCQCDAVVPLTPLAASTPRKPDRATTRALPESPIPSPPSSPEPSPKKDLLYKPSDLSLMEAKDEEHDVSDTSMKYV